MMGDVKRPALYTARDGTQTWKVRYRNGGRQSSQTFERRADAERFCSWIERHGVAGALEYLAARQSSTDTEARTVTTCPRSLSRMT